jgi:hypothetical protein
VAKKGLNSLTAEEVRIYMSSSNKTLLSHSTATATAAVAVSSPKTPSKLVASQSFSFARPTHSSSARVTTAAVGSTPAPAPASASGPRTLVRQGSVSDIALKAAAEAKAKRESAAIASKSPLSPLMNSISRDSQDDGSVITVKSGAAKTSYVPDGSGLVRAVVPPRQASPSKRAPNILDSNGPVRAAVPVGHTSPVKRSSDEEINSKGHDKRTTTTEGQNTNASETDAALSHKSFSDHQESPSSSPSRPGNTVTTSAHGSPVVETALQLASRARSYRELGKIADTSSAVHSPPSSPGSHLLSPKNSRLKRPHFGQESTRKLRGSTATSGNSSESLLNGDGTLSSPDADPHHPKKAEMVVDTNAGAGSR